MPAEISLHRQPQSPIELSLARYPVFSCKNIRYAIELSARPDVGLVNPKCAHGPVTLLQSTDPEHDVILMAYSCIQIPPFGLGSLVSNASRQLQAVKSFL